MLKAIRWKKTRIGLGLDRGGCTLANPKRLWTVEEHENVFRFVNDDDDEHLSPE